MKIGVIVSTTRPTRVGRKVADWVLTQVKDTEGLDFEIIDLKDEDLPFLNEVHSPSTGKYELESTKAWSKKIDSFDGFILVTAEYNHGYPAPLKNALDSVFHEWHRKPVAFVGYGTYGAAHSIDQLISVTAKLGMVPLGNTVVGIVKPWEAVQEDGSISPELVMGHIDGLVENLRFWTEALKS